MNDEMALAMTYEEGSLVAIFRFRVSIIPVVMERSQF